MNEIRIFGPPGTGKTTSLAKFIAQAVGEVGRDKVLVSSFSKAAAQEIAGRGIDVDKGNVGTLHALCYRAIGSPEIAELHIDEFNREFPQLRIEEQKKSAIDTPEVFESGGPDYLMQYNLLRSRGSKATNDLISRKDCNHSGGIVSRQLSAFIQKWEDWKSANNLFDFTDMLVIAKEDFETFPGNPRIGFFDEVQDFNPLMMEVVHQWSNGMDYTILAGDEDQTIYSFMGSSPTAMLGTTTTQTEGIHGTERRVTEERVLSQSYRLPKRVKEWSEKWIKQVSLRKEKNFSATEREGCVRSLREKYPTASYRNPAKILEEIQRDLSDGLRVMVLASCSYMMTPLLSMMRAEGVPFSNHYRPSNGSWNPFPKGSDKRVPSWQRLMSFINAVNQEGGRDQWTWQEFQAWRKDISPKAPGLVPGSLKMDMNVHGLTQMDIGKIFDGASERPPFEGDSEAALMWFRDALIPSKVKAYEFAMKCAQNGMGAQLGEPIVTVGTIHSVKGGEADSVYVFPDLSTQAARSYFSGKSEEVDPVTRLFYVATTRAKEKVSLVGPYNNSLAVRWIK